MTLADAPVWASVVEAIGAAAAALVGAGAVVFAWYQLGQTRKANATALTHHYVQRYDDPERIPFLVKAYSVIGSGRGASVRQLKALYAEYDALSFKDQFEVELVLNFWEEMAGMYNRGLLNQQLVVEYFGDAALDLWKKSEWLVSHIQERAPGQSVYNEWEKMREDILRRRSQP